MCLRKSGTSTASPSSPASVASSSRRAPTPRWKSSSPWTSTAPRRTPRASPPSGPRSPSAKSRRTASAGKRAKSSPSTTPPKPPSASNRFRAGWNRKGPAGPFPVSELACPVHGGLLALVHLEVFRPAVVQAEDQFLAHERLQPGGHEEAPGFREVLVEAVVVLAIAFEGVAGGEVPAEGGPGQAHAAQHPVDPGPL